MAYEGLGFFLVPLEEDGFRYSLYTFQFFDSPRTEFEKWTEDKEINSHQEYSDLYGGIRALPDQGLPDDLFWKREDYQDHGFVTPLVKDEHHHELRLYCINREGANWVILGNGCVKRGGGSLQEYNKCEMAFSNIAYVDRRVQRRMRPESPKRLHVEGNQLDGDFEFSPEHVK